MKNKLLALDLDRTTLNSKHVVDDKTAESIKNIINKGIKVTIISGREPKSIVSISEQVGLKGLIGSMNGAIVTTFDGKNHIMNFSLSEIDVKSSIELAKKMNFSAIAFIENDSYIETKDSEFGKIIDKFTDNPSKEVGDLNKFLLENKLYKKVNKIVVVAEYEDLLKYKKQFESSINDCELYFSLPFVLEVTRKDISKGKALEFIANYYGVKQEEIIAIGDGENDISMLKFAGKGIAMKNAMDNVKEVVDEMTDSNDKLGVVKVIEKYFL